MKKTSFAVGSLMFSSLILAGCFGTKTDSQEDFTIASCNDYVKLMKCVAEKSGGGQEALTAVDQAIAAWKTLPEDQLTQTCNMAVEAVASNASAYIQLGCEVPASAAVQEVVEQPTMSGEVETTATGEIEATTGEDAAIVESVVNEVVS
jgi:L-fucose mutarotase/ribose pyranase (RbsD/FucU family)